MMTILVMMIALLARGGVNSLFFLVSIICDTIIICTLIQKLGA